MRTFLLLSTLCIILLASCSTDLTVDLPPRQQDLVIYGFINPNDSVSTVFVNRTAGLKEDLSLEETLLETPATVTLWDGSELIASFSPGDESPIYAASIIPFGVTGQSYLIRAEHPEFGTSEARSTLPAEVEIEEIKAIQNFYSRNNELISHGIEITFEDPVEETNLYTFSFFNDPFGTGDLALTTMQLVDIIAPDMPEVESIQNNKSVTLSDEAFNGQRVSLRFRSFSGNNQPPSENAYVQVRFLDTPEYFHLQSLYSPIEIELEPIVDPSPAYSNFDRGFGVFSLRLERNYDVD